MTISHWLLILSCDNFTVSMLLKLMHELFLILGLFRVFQDFAHASENRTQVSALFYLTVAAPLSPRKAEGSRMKGLKPEFLVPTFFLLPIFNSIPVDWASAMWWTLGNQVNGPCLARTLSHLSLPPDHRRFYVAHSMLLVLSLKSLDVFIRRKKMVKILW